MALLERVSTLVRANLNDLIDRAEHPEKMIKQIMLDMDNQLMQVKTRSDRDLTSICFEEAEGK
jgi:phage shock protein A